MKGMIMKLAEPMTKLRPGLTIKLISFTSLVARAIVSPTGRISWKLMLLPNKLIYSSSRMSRSSRSPITALEKLRPNCKTARTVWLTTTHKAAKPMVRKSAGSAKAASKAMPMRMGMAAAKAAFPNAPINVPTMSNLWRIQWENSQREGLLWSEV